MNEPIRYRRLPGRRMGFFHSPSAWLADDHILLIGGSRFREVYQRVYLRDVQAILVRRKPRFVMQWPYILTPLPLAFLFGVFPKRYGEILGITFAAIGLLIFLSMRFGCYLDIATAVGSIRLPAVASTFTARRFSQKVTPPIMLAQKPVVPVEATAS